MLPCETCRSGLRLNAMRAARPWGPAVWAWLRIAAFLVLAAAGTAAAAQPLLEGEFGGIDLGRELASPSGFPTLNELRRLVRDPQIRLVLMFKLYGDQDHHHLPVWSEDGQKLAFQRRQIGVDTSKICLFNTLAQPDPTLLTQEADDYDYMFRWGVNSPASFVFARIQSRTGTNRVYFSPDGSAVEPRTPDGEQCFYPALYERTDGIRWLAFERRSELILQAWKESQQDEQTLAAGTTPRWSRDGRRLLLARQRAGELASYDIYIHHRGDGSEILLAGAPHSQVRSPTWSPAETHAAWFQRDSREDSPWHIEVCPAAGTSPARIILSQVVVNPNYKSEGPSWEPSGQRVWCFSHDHRQQEYYPLIGAAIGSGAATVVDYPQRYTSANDLAVNPQTGIPEMAFTARERTQQDLFIVLLNHY